MSKHKKHTVEVNNPLINKRMVKNAGIVLFIISWVFLFGYALDKSGLFSSTETGSGAPESGVTSRIKAVYEAIGSSTSDSPNMLGWGDWGAMWNRIYRATTWTQSEATYNLNASLAPANVPVGQTFYTGTNRTLQVGTGPYPSNFINQSLCAKNDSISPCNQVVLPPATPVASTWTNTVALNSQPITTQEVWRDDRTGLYWSEYKGAMTNDFTIASCGFFPTSQVRGTHWTVGTTCGAAIDYCKNLDQVSVSGGPSKTNWYLPTKFELEQAYQDNMYNKAGSSVANANTFTTTNLFWSSSEYSGNPAYAWYVYLNIGYTNSTPKPPVDSVRCVSRDL